MIHSIGPVFMIDELIEIPQLETIVTFRVDEYSKPGKDAILSEAAGSSPVRAIDIDEDLVP